VAPACRILDVELLAALAADGEGAHAANVPRARGLTGTAGMAPALVAFATPTRVGFAMPCDDPHSGERLDHALAARPR
jgi:hypothetical protein